MLRQLRENSRSVLVWVLFAIIIGFFIISFGPQASQDQFTCTGADGYVVKVNDSKVDENSWRFGMNGYGFGGGSSARARQSRARETIMDGLIERELFAQMAEDMGYRIPDSMLEERIAAGDIYILGNAVPGSQIYFDENGGFDFDRLNQYIGSSLGLNNMDEFRREQTRELLAELARQTLMQSTRVSPEEVLARYRRENTTVTFDYVKWDPNVYSRGLDPTPAQIQVYLARHDADVKKTYETDERLYKGVKPQVKARHIFVRRDNPAPPPAPEGADAGAVEAPDPTLDPGHAKASAALARITAGEPFADVAKELSDDTRTKARGGYLGWRSATSIVGGPEVSEAVKGLKDGGVSEVITTERGFYVVTIESRREGDLSYDDVKLEIAEKMALEFFGKEGARQDAQAALDEAKASGKTLAELFPKPVPVDKGEPNVIEGQEPEEDGTKTGRILYEGPNIPASFQAKDRKAPPAAAAGGDDEVPIPEEVPRPADLPKPIVASSGSIARSGAVLAGPGMKPYIGRSPELAKDLFGSLEKDQLAGKVYQVDQAFVIVQITDRSNPDMESFEKQKNTLSERYRSEKNQRTVDEWAYERCRTVAERGDISVNTAYVTYTDPDSDDPLPLTYNLCSGGGLPQN